MIKTGVAFILVAAVLWFLAFPLSLLGQFSFILFPSAMIIGGLGAVVLLIGVVLDRIKDKKEEDPDDLSKY